MSRFTITLAALIASVALVPSAARAQGAPPRNGGASAPNAGTAGTVDDASASESANDASTNDASTNDASTNDASTNDASTNDASANAGSANAASTNDASTNDASTNDASTNDASTNAGSANAASANAAMPADDATPTRAPRVATVLVGDPEPVRRARAAELDARLERVGLRRLGDPAMRAALLGDVREDDGLERLHAARRRLLFEDDPADALRDLGARLRVDALVVVRAADPLRIAVFDLAAGTFYEDEPTLDDLDAAAAFVRRAARAAARRASSPASAPSPAEAAASAAAASETDSPAATTTDTHRPARRWLKSNWAYLVGGALLVGVVTGFIVRGRLRQDDNGPPPILRFQPGLE
ncbi:MAG: hypothetical protein MUE69_20840 [Myxococcota bacterium]|nr:hypothetical protein [Myxococcota bacterium]